MKHGTLSTTWRESQVDNGPVQWAALMTTAAKGESMYHNFSEHRARVLKLLIDQMRPAAKETEAA